MSGWEKAKEAAWHRFGHRWWKWIIGWQVAKQAAPFAMALILLGATVGGIWHLASNPTVISAGRAAAIIATIAAVIAWIAWAIRRWANPLLPAAWGMRAASAIITIAALTAVWRWT